MVKSVRPESRAKSGAGEHSTECVANGLMGTLTRPILMGGIGTSKLDLISKIGESVANLVTFTEFTTTIHAYIFVGASSGGIVSEPTVKPIDRRSFGSERASENTATVVISDEDVTCLTIEANEIIETFGVAAPLDHERKIDRKALKAYGGNHDGIGTTGSLAEFSGEANCTIVDRTGHG